MSGDLLLSHLSFLPTPIRGDAIELGYTALSSSEIEDCVSKLKEEWAGASYAAWRGNLEF